MTNSLLNKKMVKKPFNSQKGLLPEYVFGCVDEICYVLYVERIC